MNYAKPIAARLGFAFLLSLTAATLFAGSAAASTKPLAPRKVVSLDGQWQVEQGSMEAAPAAFTHTVPVPGLIDMARPPFAEVGKRSPLRQAFWYRRTFTVEGPAPAVAILKVHKARYGTKVVLNGKVVGEYLDCFTPTYLDVREALKGDGQENELVIRVGADRETIPQDTPAGWDFEKYLFIPGIYDSVELILTGEPYIENVQIVPDIEKQEVRIVAEIRSGEPTAVRVQLGIFEAKSGKQATPERIGVEFPEGQSEPKLDLTVPIDGCRLWSPDDPFLYELRLSTGGDAVRVRFGMRSFEFREGDKRAFLNGKPYPMRGTNVCVFRFFEDAARADLPWRPEWVRRLHQQFKWMHWNSIRYCIGFPPEFWYDIADEEGFLIQDEFPIWLLDKAPENPKAEKIIPQYTAWMRERWNHPCVVIWDAQNESHTDETGKALQAVRGIDLSGRPWENGWAEPQAPTDCVESHPYLFIRTWTGGKPFRLSEMPQVPPAPHLNNRQQKLRAPIIINEYCWLWLNRDGTPTCLTDKVYESILGPNSTTDQRRLVHARYVAALTEFWRCHREAAGVLHFCGLGYSRSGDKPRPEGGATSDHFIDLEKLTYEANFAEYVREAFNPVGLMLDYWADEAPAGAAQEMKVYVINDLETEWSGAVRVRVLRGDREVATQSQPCKVGPLGREILRFTQTMPAEPGDYTLVADLTDAAGATIRSLRDVKVK